MKITISIICCIFAIITSILALPILEHSGEATYYDPGLGACGNENTGSDFVAALAGQDFDPFTPNGDPNKNSLCGSQVKIKFKEKFVKVAIVDRCVACEPGDIDLSSAAFKKLADLTVGRIPVSWKFVSG